MAKNTNSDSGGISPEAAQLGAAAISSIGGLAVNAAKNKKQWKYQQKAMELQKQMNLEAWNLQNAYNTPQAQMERLQAAGLNPRLIYGEGSSAPNMSGPLDAPTAPVREATGAQVPDLLQYYQIRQMDAQWKQTTMATELMEKKSGLADIETGLKNLNLMREEARAGNYESLARSEQLTAKWVAQRSQQLFYNEDRKGLAMDQLAVMRQKQITGVDLDNAFKQYRNELAKHGIYSSDHPAFRVLLQGARRMNMDLGDLLSSGVEEIKSYLKK